MRHPLVNLISFFIFILHSHFAFSEQKDLTQKLPLSQDLLSTYQLDSGDLIKIKVFGEEDLSMEVRLSDAGTISYPLLGELQLTGQTTGEVERKLTAQLGDGYLIDPKVTITVLEYRNFFIGGEVKKPGGYVFSPGLTVQMAISLAGGMTAYGSDNKITIIREKNGKKITLDVDYVTPILPGDLIHVDEGLF